MQNVPLAQLINDLDQEMIRLGYTIGTMNFYRRRWENLLQFAKERGETFYSEQLGIDYVEKYFHILEKDLNGTLSQSETQELRVIRMIGNFQLHRTILRRYYKHKEILTDQYFIQIRNRFKQYCSNKDYSKVTIDHYVKQSSRFMDYLSSQKVTECKEINITLINNYIKTLAGYTYKTVEQNICSIRAFLRFLLETGEIQTDLAGKTPMVQARKQTRIPSVWTEDELKKLIAAIDRGSPKGKRDYAIILMACCLGLRCKDIKNLKIEHFHWEEKRLVFTQSKTRQLISLPLTPEVGWAVIDYLKYGRPKVGCPYIFVKHMAPFGPFSEEDHLNQLIKRYMEFAHIPTLKKRRGMHSLRHTIASKLLEKDTPLSTISDILGHVDTNSTSVYLKVDINKLRECSIDFEEGSYHE
ncbi:site-specific integrase [Neobacillus sp. PS3-12]|uniref:site-specific integrase n=1 Tax=Neobacillus sp. PS3-12 TaxID=3070677 RepID=UPI0027DED281|nr:site-specific integrase [Neobacillus sp. PS3-12]WML51088.1 site-specific integrase [Neobacillus sp. PS3-12]WML51681.1 site-specific integrase [Neobacillus sp. PS3-12]WML52238.1 site-specific integrase [Neobacillus sp. PS3-12]WML53161.1 site-specific integrase [Neobacillus sp. PS3-12]